MPSSLRNKIPALTGEPQDMGSDGNALGPERTASGYSSMSPCRKNKMPSARRQRSEMVPVGNGQCCGSEKAQKDLGTSLSVANEPLRATPGTWLLEALRDERMLLEQTLERRHRLLAKELEAKLGVPQTDWAYTRSFGASMGESSRADHARDWTNGRASPASPPQRPKAQTLPLETAFDIVTYKEAMATKSDLSEPEDSPDHRRGRRHGSREDARQPPVSQLPSLVRNNETWPSGSETENKSAAEENDNANDGNPVPTPNRRKRKNRIKNRGDTDSIEIDLQTSLGRNWRMLRKFVTGIKFELFFVTLIFANAVVMAVEAQYMGIVTGQEELSQFLGSDVVARDWGDAEAAFAVVDMFFGVMFTLELVLKIVVLGRKFPRQCWNMFDVIVVVTWYVDRFGGAFLVSPLLMRILRLSKAMRLIRLARMFSAFDSLSLMVCSLRASVSVASWSLLLLLTLTMVAAMVMNVLTKGYIADLRNDDDRRLEVYMYFGTFSRSMLSMTEVTLGNWVPIIRTIQEYIGEWLAFGILAYQLCVGFAVVRVITGVFLHETFKVAGNDDEMMILHKHREIEHFKDKIGTLFAEADEDGDNMLSQNEFDKVLDDVRMREWLGSMGFEINDARMAWDLMDHSKKGLTVAELGSSIQRLKGPAKSIDIVYVEKLIDNVCKAMARMERHVLREVHQTNSNQSAFTSEPDQKHVSTPANGKDVSP